MACTSEPLHALCSSSSAAPAHPPYCPSRPPSPPRTLTCECYSKEDIRCGVARQSVTRHRCGVHAHYPREHHWACWINTGWQHTWTIARKRSRNAKRMCGRPARWAGRWATRWSNGWVATGPSINNRKGDVVRNSCRLRITCQYPFKNNLWTFQPPQLWNIPLASAVDIQKTIFNDNNFLWLICYHERMLMCSKSGSMWVVWKWIIRKGCSC
jgi:hypothetical protein